MMHAPHYVPDGLVGFVDSDTIFVSPVTSSGLFELDAQSGVNNKPRIFGFIGPPQGAFWAGVSRMTAEFLGFKEELRCMSYWPVVYHVKHVAAFRKYVVQKHGQSFRGVFADMYAKTRAWSQFNLMCNYM